MDLIYLAQSLILKQLSKLIKKNKKTITKEH